MLCKCFIIEQKKGQVPSKIDLLFSIYLSYKVYVRTFIPRKIWLLGKPIAAVPEYKTRPRAYT